MSLSYLHTDTRSEVSEDEPAFEPVSSTPSSTIYALTMGACRHGQDGGGTLPPENVVKCFFVPQILLKVSVDKVFMHYFEKMLSASGASPPHPTGILPLEPAGLPTHGKKEEAHGLDST